MRNLFRLRRGAVASLLALAALTTLARSAGAGVPPDAVLHGFEPTGDYVIQLDGKPATGDVYMLANPSSILIVSSSVGSPVLLSPRARTVETVPMLKVSKQPNGTVDILADAVLQPAGTFTIGAEGDVSFKVGGHAVALREKAPLLGTQKLAAMFAYSSSYRKLADDYSPSAPILDRLRKQTSPVTITVYFGSWCPHCKQMVPRMMKVAEGLVGSKIAIDYYGLPKKMSDDPKTKQLSLPGVPTGIVMQNGKEIGRIQGDAWKIPELAISNILTGGSTG